MKKSTLYLFVILWIITFVLSACGCRATKSSDNQTMESEQSGETIQSPVNTNTESPLDDGKVRIRWFVGLGSGTDPDQVKVEQAVVDAFNQSQKDIELVLDVVPYESARDILAGQLADGNGPDIVGPVGVGGANFFFGQWLDLSPLIESLNYDTAVYNQALVDFYRTGAGQLSLPFAVFPTVLFYQKNMFDEAGLNYPPADFGNPYIWPDGNTSEWNWETLAEVAKRLTFDTNGLTPLDDGFDRNNITQVGYHLQWDGPITIGSFWEPGRPFSAKDDVFIVHIPSGWKSSWEWWFQGMWGEEPFMANGSLAMRPEFGVGNIFNARKAAMTQTQSWYTCCLANAGENWDLAAFPSYQGVIHGRIEANSFYIWKNTQNPEAAFEVLTYLVGSDGVSPLIIGDEDSPGGAYGAMPALPKYQKLFIDGLSAQFPHVENWDILLQGLNYPDNPSAEAWMPNMVDAWNRIDDFGTLIQIDGTIDFNTELESLETDLEVIFNK